MELKKTYQKARASKPIVTVFICCLLLLSVGSVWALTTITENGIVTPTGHYDNITVSQINNMGIEIDRSPTYVVQINSSNLSETLIYDKDRILIYQSDFEFAYRALIGNNLSDGDSIFFKSGDYHYNNCSDSNGFIFRHEANNIEVYGEGKSSKIISDCRPTDGSISDDIFVFINTEGISVHDIFIKGNQSDVVTENQVNKTGASLRIFSSTDFNVYNIWLEDGLTGINILGSSNGFISNIISNNLEHIITTTSIVEKVTISNIEGKQKSREGRSGYIQSCIKFTSGTRDIEISNFNCKGFFREGFRLEGVNNINFNNIILDGTVNYSGIENKSLVGFNIINASNININNVFTKSIKDDLNFDSSDNIKNIYINNYNSYNASNGINVASSPTFNYSNVNIMNSNFEIGFEPATASYGMLIRSGAIDWNIQNIHINPIDETSQMLGIRFVNNVTSFDILDSYIEGAPSLGADLQISAGVIYQGKFIGNHLRNNDISGQQLSNETAWNFTDFYSNTHGSLSNPSKYENQLKSNLTIGQKITFAFGETIDNIVDGWLRITGNLNMSGNNISNVDSIIGNNDNIRIGDAGTDSQGLTADDDLFISGKLEVNGLSYFDGNIFYFGNTQAQDNVLIRFGNSADTMFSWETTQSTASAFLMQTDSVGRMIIIGDKANDGKDYDHSAQINPTLFVHSATDPDTDNTQWVSISHNKTMGVIETGTGDLQIKSASKNMTLTSPDGTEFTCGVPNGGGALTCT